MKLRNIILTVIFALTIFSSTLAIAEEITLFDGNGSPVAYIDTDDKMTIYLWDGDPVAYLDKGFNTLSIYGFNGHHLGWFERGIVWTNDGYAAGFVEGAIPKFTKSEPFKGFRKFKPFKSFKEFEPLHPLLKASWSPIPLKHLLVFGSKN